MRCVWCRVEEVEVPKGEPRHCFGCENDLRFPCPLCACPSCFDLDRIKYIKELLNSKVQLFDPTVTYWGERTEAGLYVLRSKPGWPTEPLDPRFDLRVHSPCGFEWSYRGGGPAQLALALLADATTDEIALEFYQRFKANVVAALPKRKWEMKTEQILGILLVMCDLPNA